MTISRSQYVALKNELVRLNKRPESFTQQPDRQFSFHWIQDCPAVGVLKLRNADNVLEMMETERALRLEQHEAFIDKYSELPRIDFMVFCDTDKEWVGGVNLVLTERGLEIGKYIGNAKYLGSGVAKHAVMHFMRFLQSVLDGELELLARTRQSNAANIALNKKIGFEVLEENTDGFLLMKRKVR